MAQHRVFLPDLELSDDELVITGEEAKHASRVKRLGPGAPVRVLNGRGDVLLASVVEARRELILHVERRERVEPLSPQIHVFAATPKGQRLEKMIDSLAQVGAASWTPLETKFGVVEPGGNKIDRCERIAVEAAKQCGRAWLMEIRKQTPLPRALDRHGCTQLVLADQSGKPYAKSADADSIALLIGPEGGWHEKELAMARDAGAIVASFGPHAMRIETAAPAATAIIMHAHQSSTA